MAATEITLPASATGADLARLLRHAAAERGEPVAVFLRQITPNPWAWLNSLEQARKPKPHTIARIRALIGGASVAPGIGTCKPRADAAAPSRGALSAPENLAPFAEPRDPCVRCGVLAHRHAASGCQQYRRSA